MEYIVCRSHPRTGGEMNESDLAVRFSCTVIIGMVLAVLWSLRKRK